MRRCVHHPCRSKFIWHIDGLRINGCICGFSGLWSPAGKGLTSWPSFVMSNSEFVTLPLISWVRCGT